jgi:hypothetical protein
MFLRESAPWGQTATQWPQRMHISSAFSTGDGKSPFFLISIIPGGHSSTQTPSRLHSLELIVKRLIFSRLSPPEGYFIYCDILGSFWVEKVENSEG